MIPWNDAALHPYDHQQRRGGCYPSRQDPTTPRSNHLVTILNRFIGSVIDEPIPLTEFDYSDPIENSEKLQASRPSCKQASELPSHMHLQGHRDTPTTLPDDNQAKSSFNIFFNILQTSYVSMKFLHAVLQMIFSYKYTV